MAKKREEEYRVFHVVLNEEQFISLANLAVTLHENMDGLKTIPDFESDKVGGVSVAETVECGFVGLEAVLGQLEW